MKLKRSLFIGGQDYTDRLISVSSIDVGVRGLGFGYVSDITCELAFEPNLLDAVGQTAEVGLLVEGKSLTYRGSVEKVEVKTGKAILSVRMKRPREYFKPRQRYYIAAYNRYVPVPIVYGNGSPLMHLLAVKKQSDGYYQFLVGDRNVSGGYQITNGVYGVDYRVPTNETGLAWTQLPDGSWGLDISLYKENRYIRVDRPCYDMYGQYEDENGTTIEEFLGNSGVFIQGGKYLRVRTVHNPPPGVLCAQIIFTEIYIWDDLTAYNPLTYSNRLAVSSVSSPVAIVADIFQRNGIPYTQGTGFLSIDLSFQADASFYDVTVKCAEQGLLYIIPVVDGFRIVPAVFSSTPSPIYTFDNTILPSSLSIEKTPASCNKLTLVYDRESITISVGSGTPEKEYKADYIIDDTSANTFANAYLQYHQKTMKVKFSTPLLPELLGVDVGDIVSVDYPMYGITGSFQVIQKTIRKEKIDWVVREV